MALKIILAVLGTVFLTAFIKSAGKDAALTIALSILVIFVATSMIVYPAPSFKAAERGLAVWWQTILPALLPFFIAAELLMQLGVVHFLGVLAEPLMRPIFNVPGSGAFTFVLGLASGYPLGAALSAKLKDEGLATKTESERLMCFCTASNPLFMSGAVAVGMFKRADIAGIIMGAHYISAVAIGLLLRFWKRKELPSLPIRTERGFIVSRAYKAMRKEQKENAKPFGELLGLSVRKSINSLLSILGFMALFSVVAESLSLAGFSDAISSAVAAVVPESVIPAALHDPLVSGLFEMTMGASAAASADAPLIYRVAICSAIIAWSGLSVHAQVAALIQPSGMSVAPFTLTRIVQAIIAGVVTYAMMLPKVSQWSLPTFEPYVLTGPVAWLNTLGAASKSCVYVVTAICVASIALTGAELIKRRIRGA